MGRTEDTRRRILDASAELVAERGVRGVSFREVARRASVSHQAPYHHFGDYAGILRALAVEGFRAMGDAMQHAADAHDDALDAVEAAGVAYVAFAASQKGHFRVMFDEALVDVHHPDHPVEEAYRTYEVIAGLSRRLVASGHGRGLPAEAVTVLCWSTVHGLATLAVEGVLAGKEEHHGHVVHPKAVVKAMRQLLAT